MPPPSGAGPGGRCIRSRVFGYPLKEGMWGGPRYMNQIVSLYVPEYVVE